MLATLSKSLKMFDSSTKVLKMLIKLSAFEGLSLVPIGNYILYPLTQNHIYFFNHKPLKVNEEDSGFAKKKEGIVRQTLALLTSYCASNSSIGRSMFFPELMLPIKSILKTFV